MVNGGRILLVCALAFLAVVPFQNCSNKAQLKTTGTGQQMGGGNGEGYGGKPDASYYHFVPEFTCEGREAAFREIRVEAGEAKLIENNSLQCAASETNLQPSDVDRSPYQGDLVGYQDKIFELKERAVTEIPDELVEAWCFDDPNNKQLEVVHRYDRVLSAARAVIRRRVNNTLQEVQPTNVSRVVEMRMVKFRAQDYSLDISKDTPTTTPGQFVGVFSANLDGQQVSLQLSCRLGGYLDARLWPAPLVVDGNVNQYEYLPATGSILASVTKMFENKSFLSELFLSTGSKRALTNVEPVGRGTANFKMAADSRGVYFRSEDSATPGRRLYYRDPGGTIAPHSPPMVASDAEEVREFEILKSGGVVYRAASQDTSLPADAEPWLWRVATPGSTPVQLNPNLGPGDIDFWYFDVSEPLGRIAYAKTGSGPSCTNSCLEWFSVDFDGNNRVALPIPSGFRFGFGSSRWQVGAGNQHLILAMADAPLYLSISSRLVAAAVDGSSAADLGIYGYVEAISSDRQAFYVNGVMNSLTPVQPDYLVKVGSWEKTQLPQMISAQFTPDGRQLVGYNSTGVHVVDVATGAARTSCAGMGQIRALAIGKSGGIFIADDSGGVVSLYRSDLSTCRLVNRIPAVVNRPPTNRKDVGVKIVVSSDETQLALMVEDQAWAGLTSLYWVPGNGQAPVKVSAPVTALHWLQSAEFTLDSKTLLFWGRQVDEGLQLFGWPLP